MEGVSWLESPALKRSNYWSVTFLWGKSIFYTTLVPLKVCKLLLLHFTCSWRSPQHLIGKSALVYLCVCACLWTCQHARSTWCVSSPGSPTVVHVGVRGMSQGQSSHTVTILQAHPSIDLSLPPSIHVLKHITEMAASDVPLPPLALKSHCCALYASGGTVYHGHNTKHKYTYIHSQGRTHVQYHLKHVWSFHVFFLRKYFR